MVEKGPVALKMLLEAARSNSGIRRRRPWSKQGLLRRRMPVFAAPLASRQDRQEVAGPVACSRLRCRLRFRFGFLHPIYLHILMHGCNRQLDVDANSAIHMAPSARRPAREAFSFCSNEG